MLLQEGRKEISHEVLHEVTLMALVCAIFNLRQIAAIDSDSSSPMVPCPNILLTQKQGEIGNFSENLGITDMYSASWKQVQVLSDIFWEKWRSTYLDSLKNKHKWSASKPNLKTGDIILLREKNTYRNLWPTGIVERPIESDDKMVRKAAVCVIRDDLYSTL